MNFLLITLASLAGYCNQDSLPIAHEQDGLTNEWPVARFETDPDSTLLYAFDNDGTNLYVAIQIEDFRQQVKIMRMGMRFFIDVKGKKKENTGIEFPVKRDQQTTPPASHDKKSIRESMVMNMIMLRLFGFEGLDEPKDQSLLMKNSANVAYSFDDSDIMHIEYRIPLAMIDKPGELKDKTISLGWKINGIDASSVPAGANFSGRHAPGRPPRPTGGKGGQQPNIEKLMKEQYIWSKYTLVWSS
jgi:hypothetical protein